MTAFERRVQWLVLLYGVGWTVTVALGAALGLAWGDYLLRFHDRGLRVMLSLALIGAWAWACYHYLYGALYARVGRLHLAQRVQRRFPELGDRLASAVEFLHQPEDDHAAGSVLLRRAVIAQVAAEVESLDFRAALDSRPAGRAILAMIAVGLAAALLTLVHPAGTKVAAARLLNPWSDATWPRSTRLVLRRHVEQVGRGQAFEVEVIDARARELPPLVRIHYRFLRPDGTQATETSAMRPLGDARIARRENIAHPFAYRIEGGDDNTMGWTAVAVIEPPAIASLAIRAVPPAYTGWAPYDAQRQIHALIGTRLEFSGQATKPLSSATLCFDDGRQLAAQLVDESGFRIPSTAGHELLVTKSLAYWFVLTDRDGLTVASADRGEIRAAPDAPPRVSIEQPGAESFVTHQAVIPVRVLVKDDLAVRSVDLLVARSDRPTEKPVRKAVYRGPEHPRAGIDARNPAEVPAESRSIEHAWELEALDLRPGTELTIQAEAADYRPATARSEPRRVHVITPEELQDRLGARQSLILAELERALRLQQESHNQVAALSLLAARSGRLKQADLDHLQGAALTQRQAERMLTSRSEGIPQQVLGLLDDLDNNRVDGSDLRRHMESILAQLGRLEKEHLPRIAQELTAAVKAASASASPARTDPQPVAPALAEAGRQQQQVIEAVRQLLARLGQWDSYRRFHREMGRLLRDEEDVTQRTAALGRETLTRDFQDLLPQQQADLHILARQQLELALRLDQLREEMRQTSERLQGSDPLAADTLADAVNEIQRRAVGTQMRSVQEQVESNRMGQAVQEQKRIIDDVREIVDRLAGRREDELARLAQKLGAVRDELDSIVRRETDLRDRLRHALREAETIRRQAWEQLHADQIPIAADARSVAQMLARLAAERAGQGVAHAADRMERGAGTLARGDGSAALTEVEAAQALLSDAVRALQEHRQQVEANLEVELHTQLDRAIQDLAKQQEKLRQDTRSLDAALQVQGRLNPDQAVTLADLARRQATLQTQAQALGDRQASNDATGTALHGASNDMRRAADQLDRRQPGWAAQQAQADALRRLALIRAASPSGPPGQDESASDDDRAGQGSADDEHLQQQLRLVKSLQEEINFRTRQIGSAGSTMDDDTRRHYLALSEEQGALAEVLQKLVPSAQQSADRRAPSRPKVPAPKERQNSELPPELMGDLPAAAPAPDEHPLASVGRQMHQVQQRIALADCGPPTQESQRRIVAQLSQLIDEGQQRAQQRVAQNRSAAAERRTPPTPGPPRGTAAQQPGAAPGTAQPSSGGTGQQPGIGPRQVSEIQRQFWGELPEKSRETLFQSAVEEFLPQYETMIEQYYRRLAEEKGKR